MAALAVRRSRRSRGHLRSLLVASWLSLWNAAWRRGPGRRWATVLGLAALGLLWLGAIPLAALLLKGPLQEAPGRLLIPVTGALVLLTGFTLVTSLSFAVASAYFARDLEWLMTVPLSERSLLAHRLLAQVALGVVVGSVLLGPLLLGAALRTATLEWTPLLVVALIALLAVPVALGLLLVVIAVRLVPATRVRDAAAALICGVGLSMAAIAIGRPPVGPGLSWAASLNALGAGALHSVWFPPAWAARVVTLTWSGDPGAALGWLGLLLLLSLVAVAAAIWIGAPLLREGWARAQTAPRGRGRAVSNRRRLPAVLSVLRKDALSLRRDPVQLSQLILPLALFAIYLLEPQPAGGSQSLFRDFPSWYGPLTTASFAALFVASGLGLRAVGSEGRNFWCLRSAPLSLRDLLLGKLALPFVVAVGASLALLWSDELRQALPIGQLAFSTLLLVACVSGLVALATGLGATWPRLDWTDPRRASGIWLSVVFLVTGAAYIAVCLVALTVPLLIPQLGPTGSELASLLACALVALVAAAGSLRMGHARLARLEV
ncbi:MAG: putative ABC transporter permease subunit [Candidatus Dormibacteria bacterium]